MSTGINPHSWPVPPALREAGWERLPSRRDLGALLGAAREAYRVPDGLAVVAAPGTQALIQWMPRLAPAGPVAVVGPTYVEHARAWRSAGFEVSEVSDLDAAGPARNVVLVSPNNPDGRVAARARMLAAARSCAEGGGWLVVDGSFADVAPEASIAGRTGDLPVVTMRSFGKFFGLAGLRLGFAIAPPRVASRIEEALGPWAVSGPALAIGTGALSDRAWAGEMRATLARERGALDGVLWKAGLTVVGGTDLFRLVRVPGARRVQSRLAAHRIWVRSFAWADDLLRFGLPRDDEARARLAVALAEISRHA